MADTLSAILQRDPDWNALPPSTPPAVRRLLRRCLERDLRRRLHAIAHARLVLEDALEPPGDRYAPVAGPPPRVLRWRTFAVLALAGLATVVRTVNLARVGFDPTRETTAGGVVPLTQGLRDTSYPQVSPDGSRVSFCTIGKRESIFTMRAEDGTGLQQLTSESRDRSPRWSPDGKRILFFSTRSGRFEVWSINQDGGAITQHTDFGCSHAPLWSPDGARFVCHRAGLPVIVRFGEPGRAHALRPWEGAGQFTASDWSPDGRRLAGALLRPGGMNGVVVYTLETGEYRQLTDFGRSPQWLRDSRRMIFQHVGRLYLADARDGRTREVFSVLPYEIDDFIGLAPDDRTIVFALVAAEADIWVMDLPER